MAHFGTRFQRTLALASLMTDVEEDLRRSHWFRLPFVFIDWAALSCDPLAAVVPKTHTFLQVSSCLETLLRLVSRGSQEVLKKGRMRKRVLNITLFCKCEAVLRPIRLGTL